MRDELLKSDRVTFLSLVALVQGGLFLFSLVLGWFIGFPPWNRCDLTVESVGLGAVATIPMLLILVATYRSQFKSLVQIRRFLQDNLGRPLVACNGVELCAVAFMAGVSEEFLFRGVVEPYLSRSSPLIGIVLCSVLFGACHAVTPMYAALTSLLGCYLSLAQHITAVPNLAVPVVCHSLYDFVAFVVVRNSYRRDRTQNPPNGNGPETGGNTPNAHVYPVGGHLHAAN